MAAALVAVRSTGGSFYESFSIKRAGKALAPRRLPDEDTWEGCYDMELLMFDG
jgi:hypothetical protein